MGGAVDSPKTVLTIRGGRVSSQRADELRRDASLRVGVVGSIPRPCIGPASGSVLPSPVFCYGWASEKGLATGFVKRKGRTGGEEHRRSVSYRGEWLNFFDSDDLDASDEHRGAFNCRTQSEGEDRSFGCIRPVRK